MVLNRLKSFVHVVWLAHHEPFMRTCVYDIATSSEFLLVYDTNVYYPSRIKSFINKIKEFDWLIARLYWSV